MFQNPSFTTVYTEKAKRNGVTFAASQGRNLVEEFKQGPHTVRVNPFKPRFLPLDSQNVIWIATQKDSYICDAQSKKAIEKVYFRVRLYMLFVFCGVLGLAIYSGFYQRQSDPNFNVEWIVGLIIFGMFLIMMPLKGHAKKLKRYEQ